MFHYVNVADKRKKPGMFFKLQDELLPANNCIARNAKGFSFDNK